MSEILMDGHYDCHFARTNRSSKKRCMQVGKRSQVHVKLKYTHHFYLHEVVLNPIKRRGEVIVKKLFERKEIFVLTSWKILRYKFWILPCLLLYVLFYFEGISNFFSTKQNNLALTTSRRGPDSSRMSLLELVVLD